eukprot:TRINITY_DN2875_c1_g1_i1.p1 TRINITY_DN2875_c1_g1~~TRINITY_DN2875_c1_g1_i1.p1  ORF type:complete len:2080 (+),score=730.03 TRINITY_DN2875_c1_g1_i1:59-6298(+)
MAGPPPPQPLTMRAAATAEVKSATQKLCPWEILAKGGVKGRAAADGKGRALRTVGNYGAEQGDRLVLQGKDDVEGVCVRLLEDVLPLLTHEGVAKAMGTVEKSGDVQLATKALRHDDPSTLKGLVKAWHAEYGVAPPAAYAAEDVAELSAAAKGRVGLKAADYLKARIVVEGCGWHSARSAPAVPLEWVGREFASGAELQQAAQDWHASESSGGREGRGTLPRLATYQLAVAPREVWADAAALAAALAAQDAVPVAVVTLRADPAFAVSIAPLALRRGVGRATDRWAAAMRAHAEDAPDAAPGVQYRYRAVLGAEPEADVHKSGYLTPKVEEGKGADDDDADADGAAAAPVDGCSAATIVLAVDAALLDGGAAPVASQGGVASPAPWGLVEDLSPCFTHVSYPASLLQKAVRRGRTLCGAAPLVRALRTLLAAGAFHLPELQYQRSTGTRVALWKTFMSALEDVCPYQTQDGDSSCFAMHELAALALVAHADPAFRLPAALAERLLTTQLRLQAYDHSSSLWPWRSWKWKRPAQAHSKALQIEAAAPGAQGAAAPAVAAVRNALRVALLGLPLARGERVIVRRYLGGLDVNGVWARAVPVLPAAPGEAAVRFQRAADGGGHDDGLEDRSTGDPAVPAAPWADAARTAVLNREAELAAFDCQLRPSLLLHLQAGLPGVPTEGTQHSLRALSEAVWMLSSGVNVRSLKQKLSGAAQETYRFLSFVTDAPDATTEVTPAKLGLYNDTAHRDKTDQAAWKWRTTRDGQRLTAHEALLLDVLQVFQKRMNKMLAGVLQNSARATAEAEEGRDNANRPTAATPPAPPPRRGREATAFERRTAFLQLFGAREVVTAADAAGKATACMAALAGASRDAPVLVQRVSGGGEAAGDQTARRVLADATLQRNAEAQLLAVLGKGKTWAPPPLPPVGFRWVWEVEAQQEPRAVTVSAALPAAAAPLADLRCAVGGTAVPLFDAAPLLVPCNEPRHTHTLPPHLNALLGAALYVPGGKKVIDVTALFENLEAHAAATRSGVREHLLPHAVPACVASDPTAASTPPERCSCPLMGEDDVYDWLPLAAASQLPKSLWRDLVIKLATREGTAVEVHRCARDGGKAGAALQPLSEGVQLRVLYVLAALYPAVLRRKGELRFSLAQRGAQFVHLQRVLHIAAFGSFDDGEGFRSSLAAGASGDASEDDESLFSFEVPDEAAAPAPAEEVGGRPPGDDDDESLFSFEGDPAPAAPAPRPAPRGGDGFSIATPLWAHQQEAVDRVLEGVGVGKRGFADASAVGAGKTLTALACCAAAARWLRERGLRRHGCLVLVPNNDLIGEWVQQALLHTSGLHIVAQQHTGYLISRGVSAAGGRAKPHPSTKRGSVLPSKIDADTVVVSTLGRVRDKPFVAQAGWDLVVIDECLSVQNDSALQTAEAWRQVAASRCGVLMLSATFFRSRVAKLFYMIRMLRSALPRTEEFLPTLLAEHVICYLPERTRTWQLLYDAVPLTPHAASVYQARLTAASRAQKDPRLVYGELKTVVRDLWEETDFVAAVVARCAALAAEGRRALVFANSERELQRLVAAIPGARTWPTAVPPAPGAPLVVTTQRGAYGLNLQGEADCVVCRPQPGDLLEQMKGRVDRPGQAVKDLRLHVVYAAGTVEEVEAANLRLCGAFFRQYIDPLSRLFQEKAVEASLAALHAPRTNTHGMRELPTKPTKKHSGGTAPGDLAAEFRQQLQVTAAEVCDAPAAAPAAGRKRGAKDAGAEGSAPKRAKRTPKNASGEKDEDGSGTGGAKKAAAKSAAKKRGAAAKATTGGDDGDDAGGGTAKKRKKTEDETKEKGPKKLSKSLLANIGKEAAGDQGAAPAAQRCMDSAGCAQALEWLTQQDDRLATVIATVGPPTEMISEIGKETALKSLVKSIIYQQISTKAANAILNKLLAAIGGEITVEALTDASDETLRGAGLSRQKVVYVRALAAKFGSGELADAKFETQTDAEVLEGLMSVKGMGEWSCHMFMMFKLGRSDILPVGDLAVRKAFQRLYGLAPHDASAETQVQYLPPPKEIQAIAEKWRPYRTVATWYMWHVVENKDAGYTYGS